MTFTDREQAKTITPNQVNRLNTLKKFLDDEVKESLEKDVVEGKSIDIQKMSGNGSTPFDPAKGNLDYDSTKAGKVRENYRTGRQMDLMTIEAEARRLFPGDKKKQLDYLKYVMETRVDQGNELKRFRQDVQRAQRFKGQEVF